MSNEPKPIINPVKPWNPGDFPAPLPPHEPDHGRPGNPVNWCERCRLDALASAIVVESPQRSEDLEQERDGVIAGTPKPPASLAEGGAEPYKLKEGNLVSGPNLPRLVANPISNATLCTLLNAAFVAGQASQPTKGVEGKVLDEEEVERLFNLYGDGERDEIEPTTVEPNAFSFADGLRYARDHGYLSQPLGEAVAWMSDIGTTITAAEYKMWRDGNDERSANYIRTFTIPLYRSSKQD